MVTWAEQKDSLTQIIQLLADKTGNAEKGYTIESVENFRLRYNHLFGFVEKEIFYCLYKRAHCENLLRLQLTAHQQKSREKEERSKSKRSGDHRTDQQHQELQSGKSNRKEDLSTNQQQHQELQLGIRKEPKKESIASKRWKKIVPMSKQLHFPNRVVQFSTESHDRVHVHIYPPSGFNLRDISQIDVPGGTKLVIKLKWPESFLDAEKMYSHPKFGNYFHRQHPKFITFVKKTDEIVGQNNSIESELVIDLPPGNEYHQTDDNVSGHPFINSITIRDEEIQDERLRGRKAMVVWLIDLTKKSQDKSIKYSQRDVAIMDEDSDDDDLYG